MNTRNILATVAVVATVVLSGCGKSADSTNVNTSLDTTPPSAPEGVSLNKTPEFNALSWNASPSADVTRYQVFQYSPDPSRDNAYVMIGESTTSGFTLPMSDTADNTYFRVKAVDASGNRSGFSTELAADVPGLTRGGGGGGSTKDPHTKIDE